jgi:hypothetical protein
MTCAIKIWGAQMFGATMTTPETGKFLKEFDVGAHDGRVDRCPIPTTDKIEEALHFENAGEALIFWSTESRVKPRRPDGKPNRPLTAFSVEIVKI